MTGWSPNVFEQRYGWNRWHMVVLLYPSRYWLRHNSTRLNSPLDAYPAGHSVKLDLTNVASSRTHLPLIADGVDAGPSFSWALVAFSGDSLASPDDDSYP